MLGHFATMPKTFETLGTLKWLGADVGIHVSYIIVALREDFGADVTLVFGVFRVLVHVPGQVAFVGEGTVADMAAVFDLKLKYRRVKKLREET